MSNFKETVIKEYQKQIKISLSKGDKASAEQFKLRIKILSDKNS